MQRRIRFFIPLSLSFLMAGQPLLTSLVLLGAANRSARAQDLIRCPKCTQMVEKGRFCTNCGFLLTRATVPLSTKETQDREAKRKKEAEKRRIELEQAQAQALAQAKRIQEQQDRLNAERVKREEAAKAAAEATAEAQKALEKNTSLLDEEAKKASSDEERAAVDRKLNDLNAKYEAEVKKRDKEEANRKMQAEKARLASLALEEERKKEALVSRLHRTYDVLSQTNLQKLEATVQQEIDARPDDPNAHAAMAIVLLEKGDLEKAQKEIASATSADAENGLAHVALGLWNEKQKKWDPAQKEYEAAIAKDPDNPIAYNYLGYYYVLDKGDAAHAEPNFRKAISLEPNYTRAINGLGGVYYIADRFEEAESLFKQAAALDSTDPWPVGNLGIMREVKYHDFEGAVKYYQQAVTLDPKYSDRWVDLGYYYQWVKKDLHEAEKCFQKAVDLQPDNATYHLRLASCLYHEGRKKEAKEEGLKAKKLGIEQNNLLNMLGIKP